MHAYAHLRSFRAAEDMAYWCREFSRRILHDASYPASPSRLRLYEGLCLARSSQIAHGKTRLTVVVAGHSLFVAGHSCLDAKLTVLIDNLAILVAGPVGMNDIESVGCTLDLPARVCIC